MAPIFWHFDQVIFNYSPLTAILICLFLAFVYVGSLYFKTPGQYGRDHPETVKFRFVRVTIVSILVIPFLWLCSTKSHHVKARVLFTWLGLRFQGIFMSFFLPTLLTMILFLGPLTLHYLDGIFKIYTDKNYWAANFKNLIWIRNHIVAPLAEEFIFRACLLPFLVPPFGEEMAVKICPLFFSLAHFHHLYEKIQAGFDMKMALLQSLFQFTYTTIFGAYSAFLFLRTGNLVAPVIAHAFCNHMGFPNFREVFAYEKPMRYYVITSFLSGLVLWYILLYPLTSPWLYGNDLYYV